MNAIILECFTIRAYFFYSLIRAWFIIFQIFFIHSFKILLFIFFLACPAAACKQSENFTKASAKNSDLWKSLLEIFIDQRMQFINFLQCFKYFFTFKRTVLKLILFPSIILHGIKRFICCFRRVVICFRFRFRILLLRSLKWIRWAVFWHKKTHFIN